MMHCYQLKALDRTIQDLMFHQDGANAHLTFGNNAACGEVTSPLDQHAKWLLDVGDGVLNVGDNLTVPSHLCLPPSTPSAAFLDWVMPARPYPNSPYPQWNAERAILAPHHGDVDEVDNLIVDCYPGEEYMLLSADFPTTSNEDAFSTPTELLNLLDPTGLPKHNKLALKAYMPVMLICATLMPNDA
eukprot:4338542-Pleurochrysis_carterae.AAC.1